MPTNDDPQVDPSLKLPGAQAQSLTLAAQSILTQLAQTPDAISSIQFTINLSQSTPIPASGVPAGLWMRQVVKDAAGNPVTRLSFIPDDPAAPSDHENITDPGEQAADKAVWEKLLAGKVPDVNAGTITLRLGSENKSGRITWLPNDNSNPLDVKYDQQAGGGLVVDLAEYAKCIAKNSDAGLAKAFKKCSKKL